MSNTRLLVWTVLSMLIFAACSSKTKYQRLVEKELAREGSNDSLFLGYRFGMTQQEFFDHSWELNSQKKVIQGEGNISIRYEVDDLKFSAHKNFYPKFYNGRIFRMPVKYSYNGWAPWNRKYWADSLKFDILEKFRKKYQKPFTRMNPPDLKKPAHIMIDKNKRIAIYEIDNEEVAVVYDDLRVLNKLGNEELSQHE